jgi:hypothetical protein
MGGLDPSDADTVSAVGAFGGCAKGVIKGVIKGWG